MRTAYASKSVRNDGTLRTKRYWYYTSSLHSSEGRSEVERLPVKELDRVVFDGLRDHVSDARWLADQMKTDEHKPTLVVDILRALDQGEVRFDVFDNTASDQTFQEIVTRIDAQRDLLYITVNLAALLEPEIPCDPIPATFEIPFQKRQNGRAKPIIIAPEGVAQTDPDLISLVADARRWARELLEGKYSSIQKLTEREGLRGGAVSRILPLAWLAPDISTAILEGRQPPHLTAKTLREIPDLPVNWTEQRQVLGFPSA